ncbi:MAG: hypothetical protein WC460_00370 [Patescibacteria group bacterium]
MLINQKQLKKIRVETQSGQFLGYVSDFELETETGIIEKYLVRSNNLMSGLFEGKLIIHKRQIINFDDEKMVVEDAALKEKIGHKAFEKVENVEGIEPVISSEINNQ